MNKTDEGQEVEIESVKKIQSEGILEMKNLGTKTSETRLTNKNVK